MLDSIKHIARQLAELEEPHVRYKILRNVYQRPLESREVRIVRDDVAASPLVSTLLAEWRDGCIAGPAHARWRGAHWVLHLLADLGCAVSDQRLPSLREQVCSWLLSPQREQPTSGSIEGHALHYLHFLQLADERADALAARLISWAEQWRPLETPASFAQALSAVRGLYLHGQQRDCSTASAAAERLVDSVLARNAYCKSDLSTPLSADFVSLHYPCYEHADVLFAIKVLGEIDCATDPRCIPAVQLLKSKQLADGTFPAERKYYRTGRSQKEGDSLVNWGGTHRARGNIFVTLDALGALRAAGERF